MSEMLAGPVAPEWARTGTITFLLSDVQGSTRLWETEPDAMTTALPRHDALFFDIVGRHGGHVVKSKGEGDSVFSIFPEPTAAVRAAVEIQLALNAEQWPTSKPLAVRMSIHTGDAELRDGDWYGPTVNRCARLRATAHGGQVVVSGTVHDSVAEVLPEDVTLRDLGVRRLKDLTEPERIYQLEHPELPAAFPPLAALDVRPNNLPLQPTPIVGRETEVAHARGRLRQGDVRLLTITGPGGVGKTRLGLQVAADCIDDFEHGVWFVPLAPVAEASGVPFAIANALGIADQAGVPVETAVERALADLHVLLLLDNFEHVIDGADFVARILERCAGVKVLVTSREWLHIRAEHEFPVDPLPDRDAIDLFVTRAQAVAPDFHLDDSNETEVVAICHLLDGLPLAIELVAARLRRFSIDELFVRLRKPLEVAADGPRDLPARQRTLRQTIAWSYELCSDEERQLLRSLGAFAGGAPASALEAVSGLPDVLDVAMSLEDKSLVGLTGEADDRRVTVLETIRQFAMEALEGAGEEAAVVDSHARWFDEFAGIGNDALTGPTQAVWLRRFETEHPNLRAVLAGGAGSLDLRLRLAGRLARFWLVRGHWNEGREWYERVLREPGGEDRWRADSLLGAGLLADRQGERELARKYLESCLDIRRNIEDEAGIAQALNVLGGVELAAASVEEAERCWVEALAINKRLGDARNTMLTLVNLGRIDHDVRRDMEAARRWWDEALPLAEEVGDVRACGLLLRNLGMAAMFVGELDEAREIAVRGLELAVALGDRRGELGAKRTLGQIAMLGQDGLAEARMWLSAADEIARDLGDRGARAELTRDLAKVEERAANTAEAVRLYQQAARDARAAGSVAAEGHALYEGARVAYRGSDGQTAGQLMRQILALSGEHGRQQVPIGTLLAQLLEDTAGTDLLDSLSGDPSDEVIDDAIALVERGRSTQ